MRDRYAVPNNEGYEPGSNNTVLKNFLGITDLKTIEQLEAKKLEQVSLELIQLYSEDYQFTAEDLCNIHEAWLADIYPSAGKYRTVSMSKGGFPFANPSLIPHLMSKFETKYLKKYTPCKGYDDKTLAAALSIVHLELIIIHPFREGNGRVARLLANLMALQAGKDMLDYTTIDRTQNNTSGYDRYIHAIHAGFKGDYSEIENIFYQLLVKN
ncbi:Fic/DOC family protein [Legionella septentrionalis]|nr:Fic family protein [Legionella septentrionalis]